MSFIVYTDNPRYPSSQWLADAKSKWGNSFLGLYYFDEAGGKQLDQADYPSVTSATNYSDAATQYVDELNWMMRTGPYAITKNFAYPTEYQLFTSDYALYWYDYQAGYDTVFAEFAMNYSRQLNIDLCRGAATVQNKEWGVMITWTYSQAPYMEAGPQMYNDMVLAYQNGAKYIIVFDSNENYTQNVLQQGQLDAMKQFWQYVQANPRTITPISDRTAYVLPEDYAYGFRGPQDKIWGLWPADSLTVDISMSVATLLRLNGTYIDIVYPDGPRTVESVGYQNILNWNDTRLIPTSSTIPSSSTPQGDLNLPFYETALYAIAAVIVVAVAVSLLVLRFRKNRKSISNLTLPN